jgi:hypothetical protein
VIGECLKVDEPVLRLCSFLLTGQSRGQNWRDRNPALVRCGSRRGSILGGVEYNPYRAFWGCEGHQQLRELPRDPSKSKTEARHFLFLHMVLAAVLTSLEVRFQTHQIDAVLFAWLTTGRRV